MSQLSAQAPVVVLVDDMPDILSILERSFRVTFPGARLIGVKDAASALATIAEQPVTVLVSDYSMPGMDGLSLISAVKRSDPEIFTVLITAHADPVQHRDEHPEVDALLQKPFSLDAIEEIVRGGLRTRAVAA